MRRRIKTKSMRVILWLGMGLMLSLFVLGTSNAKNMKGFTSHKGWFKKAKPVTCGIKLEDDGYYELTKNLTCSADPAIEITGPANLNLRGNTLSGDVGNNNGIEIKGNGAKVWNGTVTQFDYGIRVRSSGTNNEVTYIKAIHNYSRGIRIDEDAAENQVIKCLAAKNASQGIVIKGIDNKIFSCEVRYNCRDGIEIDDTAEGNVVFHNDVENNGNLQTCADFGEDYKPWNYAGIDAVGGSQNNEIKGNRASGNRGCFGTDESPCTADERNFLDENTTNRWEHNRPR